jgi:hypothetical protein
MERIEQIDHVAGKVIHGRRWRIVNAIVELPQVRRDDVPAPLGERELRLPHAGIQGKGVEEQQDAAGAGGTPGWRFNVSQSSNRRHASL